MLLKMFGQLYANPLVPLNLQVCAAFLLSTKTWPCASFCRTSWVVRGSLDTSTDIIPEPEINGAVCFRSDFRNCYGLLLLSSSLATSFYQALLLEGV
jgi:hypothetical protein